MQVCWNLRFFGSFSIGPIGQTTSHAPLPFSSSTGIADLLQKVKRDHAAEIDALKSEISHWRQETETLARRLQHDIEHNAHPEPQPPLPHNDSAPSLHSNNIHHNGPVLPARRHTAPPSGGYSSLSGYNDDSRRRTSTTTGTLDLLSSNGEESLSMNKLRTMLGCFFLISEVQGKVFGGGEGGGYSTSTASTSHHKSIVRQGSMVLDTVSVADDGTAGVGATAAVAVSVALAHAWAGTANSKGTSTSSSVPPTGTNRRDKLSQQSTMAPSSSALLPRTDSVRPGKTRFKLVAAVPRNKNRSTPELRETFGSTSSFQNGDDGKASLSPSKGYNGSGMASRAASAPLTSSPSGSDWTAAAATANTSKAVPKAIGTTSDDNYMWEEDDGAMSSQDEASWRASGSHLKLQWLDQPSYVMVCFKPSPEHVVTTTAHAALWMMVKGIVVYVEPPAYSMLLKEITKVIKRATTSSGGDKKKKEDGVTSNSDNTTSTEDDHHHHHHDRATDIFTIFQQSHIPPETAITLLSQVDVPSKLKTWPGPDCTTTVVGCQRVPNTVAEKLDMVLTLGGDGTVLWACSLFASGSVPPIVPFALGSLGFMTPFPIEKMGKVLLGVFSTKRSFPIMLRHRLQCQIIRHNNRSDSNASSMDDNDNINNNSLPSHNKNNGHCEASTLPSDMQVLNEVVIDRGSTPFLANLHVHIDKNFVTAIQGDGLIVSTPTGSTAYNLAAGGSMIHPGVPCVLFTPICPHTLSSRPLVFPEHVDITVKVPEDSRSEAYCSFDGKCRQMLRPGDEVNMHVSNWPVPMVCSLDASHDWFLSVREGLNWNIRKQQTGRGG